MATGDLDKDVGEIPIEEHDEDVEEASLEIEEIEKDSKTVKRCSVCKRMVFGHKGLVGKKCNLEAILDEEELRKDDKIKNEMRRKKREIISKAKENEEEKKLQEEKEKALEKLEIVKAKNKEATEKKDADKRKDKLKKEMEEISRLTKKEEEEEKLREKDAKRSRESRSRQERRSHERKRSRERRSNERRNSSRTRRSHERRDDYRGGNQRNRERYVHSSTPRRRSQERSQRRERSRDSRRMENNSGRMVNNSRWMGNNTRRMENDFGRFDNDSRRKDSIHDTVVNSMVDAFSKFGDMSDKGKDPPPVWEKTISFSGWRRSVELWSDSSLKPSKKAHLLLEMLKKDTDHGGLKELIVQEVIENEEFDFKRADVIKVMLDIIEAFVEESKWTKNVKLAREFCEFKQETGEDTTKYVIRFSAFEAKLKNEKVSMSNLFKTGFLLNQSKLGHMEKSNIMASIDMNDEPTVLEKVKKKMRENHEVNKETKEAFVATKEKEPIQTMYGDFQGGSRDKDRRNQSFGRDRSRGRSRDRGFQRDGKPYHGGFKSKSRDRSFRRSSSKGPRREQSSHRERRNEDNSVKRTYKVEKLNFDIDKTVFENENRMLIDSGCPGMVCGEAWLTAYESSCGKS